MRTEAEVKTKLDELKYSQRIALEQRLVWTCNDMNGQIKAIEWVLAMRDEL